MSSGSVIQGKSRLIATNTLTLFVRMFVIMLVNLYAVRLVLRGLGEMDYGIFNSIAGVVTMSACIASTLSVAIQRFYSIALGRHSHQELRETFSLSVNIVLLFCLIIFVVFQTAGLWFVSTQLVIPAERMSAALWIYQFSLAVLLLSILQIPFLAAIFAHEHMGIYAVVSTIECLLRMGAAWLIAQAPMDGLVFYSSGLLFTAVLVFLMYMVIARKRYAECHYMKVTDNSKYRQLFSFSGWTLFGSLSNIGLIQGSIILLNIFFGPIIVAAFAIAQQINNAFNALTNSMVLSFRPPMIKAYAEEQTDYLNHLFVACNKFVVYFLAATALPIICEMGTILHFWLGEVSVNTILFARLIVVYIFVAALHTPITIIMQAIGRIKEYHMLVESVCLLSVPLTWLLFHIGMPSYSVFFSMISLCVIAQCVRVLCIRHYYAHFSLPQYLWGIMLPALVIVATCSFLTYGVHTLFSSSILRLLFVSLLSPAIMLTMVLAFGLNSQERMLICQFIPFFRRKSL